MNALKSPLITDQMYKGTREFRIFNNQILQMTINGIMLDHFNKYRTFKPIFETSFGGIEDEKDQYLEARLRGDIGKYHIIYCSELPYQEKIFTDPRIDEKNELYKRFHSFTLRQEDFLGLARYHLNGKKYPELSKESLYILDKENVICHFESNDEKVRNYSVKFDR